MPGSRVAIVARRNPCLVIQVLGALPAGCQFAIRDEIMALIEKLWRERGPTLVLVSYDTSVIRRAQRIGVMSNGRLSDHPVRRPRRTVSNVAVKITAAFSGNDLFPSGHLLSTERSEETTSTRGPPVMCTTTITKAARQAKGSSCPMPRRPSRAGVTAGACPAPFAPAAA